jgi:hypothetical protein
MTIGWNHWADTALLSAGIRDGIPAFKRNALKKKRIIRCSLT